MNQAEGHWIKSGLAMLVLLVPVGAAALGLGEARVESYLNQNLDVRMRLLDATAEELDSLTVTPASPEDFERLGLTSGALSLDLDIEVDDSVTPPVIVVSSRRPVNDPIVQLVLDARWAGGRMLREYTLFLDPPTVDLAPPPAVVERPQPEPEPEPEPESRAADRSEPVSAPPRTTTETASEPRSTTPRAVASDRYGPVASGDTLWSIARQNRPAEDVTMDQMMIAIVELNPSAFRGGNINRLLRGAELDLPDAEQARALDAAAAAAAVAAQNRAFNLGETAAGDLPRVSDAGRDALASPQTEAEQTPSAGESTAAEPRLSLVPPGEDEMGASDGEGDSVDALRQRLARAEEELYAARQEAEEFQNRVEELEQIVRDNPGGLGIRDADLAGLEETLRAAREATRGGADPEVRAEVSSRLDEYLDQLAGDPDAAFADGDALAAADSFDDAATDNASDPALPAGDPAGSEPSVPDPQAADEGGSDRSLPAWAPFAAAAAVVVLLMVVGVWWVRRRHRAPVEPAPAREPSPAPPPPAASSQDPLTRTRARLSESPEDLDRHVELLEQLAAERKEGEFSDALETMFEHVDSGSEPQWRKALRLAGGIVPGHVLVKGSADWVADDLAERRAPESELDADAEVDDLMARLEADADADESAPAEDPWPEFDEQGEKTEGGSTAEESLDFDSIRPAAGDSPDVPGEAGRDVSAESEALEFDVPSDDSDREAAAPAESGPEEPADYDSPTLEWPEFGEYAGDEALAGDAGMPEPGAEAPSEDKTPEGDTGAASEADEIFGQSDDDIDVKLDLARAYLSWDSADSARTLLEEVLREGNETQRAQAQKLLDELGGESES